MIFHLDSFTNLTPLYPGMNLERVNRVFTGMVRGVIGTVQKILTIPKRIYSHTQHSKVMVVNSIIHSYMTHAFPEDMYWVQCMIRNRDPLIESNRSLDKMEWLIEDFKLFLCRKFGSISTNLFNVSKEVEEMCLDVYPEFKKSVSLPLLDSYVSYIHNMFSCIPVDEIRLFHPSLFDNDTCLHDCKI